MATIYVDDTAVGADNGTSWTDAYVSFNNAGVDGAAAGSDVWVASTHDEFIGASLTFNFSNGTLSSPVIVKSINTGTDAYEIGARVDLGSLGTTDISISGNVHIFGMEFEVPDNITFGNLSIDKKTFFEDCIFTAHDAMLFQGNNSPLSFKNSILTCNHNSTPWVPIANSNLRFVGCTISHPNVATLLQMVDHLICTFEDCDLLDTENLSQGMISSQTGNIAVNLRGCLLHASFSALGAGSIYAPPAYILVESCSSSTTLSLPVLPLTSYDGFTGTCEDVLTPDRTGGSDDGFNGLYARKMITNANALEQYNVLPSLPLSKRLTTNVTPSGATPQGIFTTTRMAPQGTPTALTTDGTSTWNGSGVGTKQKITHTLSSQDGETLTVFVASGATLNNDDFWVEIHEPDQVGGSLVVEAFLAKPSTTVYVDVRLDVV